MLEDLINGIKRKVAGFIGISAIVLSSCTSGGGSGSAPATDPEPQTPSSHECGSSATRAFSACLLGTRYDKVVIEWDYATSRQPSQEVEDDFIDQWQPHFNAQLEVRYQKISSQHITDPMTIGQVLLVEKDHRDYKNTVVGNSVQNSGNEIYVYVLGVPGAHDGIRIRGATYDSDSFVLFRQEMLMGWEDGTDPDFARGGRLLQSRTASHEMGHVVGLVRRDRHDHTGGGHDRNLVGVTPAGYDILCRMSPTITTYYDDLCDPCKDDISNWGGLP